MMSDIVLVTWIGIILHICYYAMFWTKWRPKDEDFYDTFQRMVILLILECVACWMIFHTKGG